jgi:DDE family transposase
MLVEIFCEIDDFCKYFEKEWTNRLISSGQIKRVRKSTLSMSEVMTIVVYFHRSGYRDFKHYYKGYVVGHLRWAFPRLVSYSRFVELMQAVLIPLCSFLHTRKGRATGISFVDSMAIRVCHNRRIHSHRVFQALAKRGKNSVGWFYGFKLHIIINEIGELLGFRLTPGNIDYRKPVLRLARKLWGKLFAGKGYISGELFEELFSQGITLITKLKKNMKNKLMHVIDKILLRKRSLIECVHDQLKNICQVGHPRHRSVLNFMVNLVTALIAYTYQPKKPSLRINFGEKSPVIL